MPGPGVMARRKAAARKRARRWRSSMQRFYAICGYFEAKAIRGMRSLGGASMLGVCPVGGILGKPLAFLDPAYQLLLARFWSYTDSLRFQTDSDSDGEGHATDVSQRRQESRACVFQRG